MARSVKVVVLPGLTGKQDLVDWAAAGHSADEWRALIESAGQWKPSDDALFKVDPQIESRIAEIVKGGTADVLYKPENKDVLTYLAGLKEADPVDHEAKMQDIRRLKGYMVRGHQAAVKAAGGGGKKGKNKKPTPTATPDGMPIIQLTGKRRPAHIVLEEIARVLDANLYYGYGESLVRITAEGKLQHVTTPTELAGKLAGIAACVAAAEPNTGYEDLSHTTLPPTIAGAYLASDVNRSLKQITTYTATPIFDDKLRLSNPGYNPESRVYYHGAAIATANGTPHLDAVLEGFPFASPADRANYLGILLDCLFTGSYHGARPALLVNANQQGTGKSHLAFIAAILRCLDGWGMITYTTDEAELEKQIAACVHSGALAILMDNAKNNCNNAIISSQVLDRLITAAKADFRLLGSSQRIIVPNNLLICVTCNNAQADTDLLQRSCPVNLYYEGSATRRTFKIKDIQGYVRHHRNDLLGELIGMVERWKAAGEKRVAVPLHRFAEWASVIGGILQANGIEGFLDNLALSYQALDVDMVNVAELGTYCMDERPRTAGELVSICDNYQVFQGLFKGVSLPKKAHRLSKVLTRYRNQVVWVDNLDSMDRMEMVFRMSDRGGRNKQRLYWFDGQCTQAESDQVSCGRCGDC